MGSTLIGKDITTVLTDGAPTVTKTVDTSHIRDLVVSLIIDKGCTVTIEPIDDDATGSLGLVSDTGTIADGGADGRWIYSNIGSASAKITVTKTEAGDSSAIELVARGIA